MLISKEEIVNSLVSKLRATDFIALRYSTGETSTWVGFDWASWEAYRNQLRVLINEVQDSGDLEVNSDILNYPMRPTIPRIQDKKALEERKAHVDKMMEEYGIDLSNTPSYTLD
jgi:hypothetical protein